MLGFWGMWSAPSLALLPGPLLPGVVAPARILSIGQIILVNLLTVCKQITYDKLNCLKKKNLII